MKCEQLGGTLALMIPLSPRKWTLDTRDGEEATKFQRKCTKEGAEMHSGVHSALQVLDHLEVPTMIFFGAIILSRLIRGHSGQGRTLLWMTGVLIELHKDSHRES